MEPTAQQGRARGVGKSSPSTKAHPHHPASTLPCPFIDILKQLASGPSAVFANFELDASGLLKVADLASKGVCRELD